MQDKDTKRRNVLKSVGAGAALAGLPSVVTAAGSQRDDDGIPFPDANYTAVGDDVREAVDHQWWLLTMSQRRIEELLQKSSAGTNDVSTYSDRVTSFRDTYAVEQSEVTSTKLGTRHTYHLVDDRVTTTSEKQRVEVGEVANAVVDGFRSEGDSVSTEWFGGEHRDMSEAVFDEIDIDSWEKDDLKPASAAPDTFGCKDCSVDWIPVPISDSVENAIQLGLKSLGDGNEARHPPFHFYAANVQINIGPASVNVPDFGGAPGEAAAMVDRANNSYGSQKATELGWAAHYLQDMSVPLHTGAIMAQVNPEPKWYDPLNLNPRRDLHKAYENYVSDNLQNASNLVGYPYSNDYSYSNTYSINGVADACQQLANISAEYSTGVLDGVMQGGKNNPGKWNNYGTDVFDITHNCMDKAGDYLKSFLQQHY